MSGPRVFKLRQAEQRPNNYTSELPPIDRTRATIVLVRRSGRAKKLSEEELNELRLIQKREYLEDSYIESREAQLELIHFANLLYGDDPPDVRLRDEGDGVSGQKRIDEREVMDLAYQEIAAGLVGTIVVAREDRLFRDKHGDQSGTFTRLLEEKKVLLLVPPLSSAGSNEPIVKYDFTNIHDLRRFQVKMDEASDYLEGHVKYMHQCKQNKADKGGYDGRALPPGLAVKGKKQNQTIVIYEPWGEKMKWLAKRAQALDWDTGQLNREVANMAYLFPEIPEEDKERYTFRIAIDHIPGVGYKPRYSQTIKGWLTNEMYIGWWQPDEDEDDVIENHHDAILDYALFAEGYARLTGYTLEGEPVENPRGVKRIRKEREDPPEALFHGRLIATPPSEERTSFVSVEYEHQAWRYMGHSAQTNGLIVDVLFTITAIHFDTLVVKRLRYLSYQDKEIAERVRITLEQMHKEQGSTFVSIHDQLNGIELQLADLLAYRAIIGEEIVQEKLKLKKNCLNTSKTLEMWEKKKADSENEENGLLATQEALENKKSQLRIVDSPEEIERVYQLLKKFDKVWAQWDLAQKQRAFSLLINRIEIKVVSPHWLYLSVDWINPLGIRPDDALIWRASGSRGEPLSDQEKGLIKQHYPCSSQLDILKLLPDRTWYAIQIYASRESIKRHASSLHSGIPPYACYRDFMPNLDGNYLFRDYETTLKYIKEASSNTVKSKNPLSALWILSTQTEDLKGIVQVDLNGMANTISLPLYSLIRRVP